MTESFIFAAPFLLAVIAAWDYKRRCAALERDKFNASSELAKGSVADLRNSVMELSAHCSVLTSRVSSYESSSEQAWKSIESLREAQSTAAKRAADLEKNQIELARRLDGSPKMSRFQRGA